ncbi:polysaccharide biosynthesis protein [Massilia eurypsychrophila]|jgi:O-antigen/teichoic acid export membrane protein|uniref:Polysaccharide biosynthesis protein n=1 Tax=Massilia eurypsychrophila TaxID=1485217 RepID=A0A2G8TGL3_9BURK|nr:oligosaccharide flippase family protein [Massilia eurypsychrophila]PIL45089.1 polysaccharide biosynthesis protein [Massilia eurypsychrophila]
MSTTRVSLLFSFVEKYVLVLLSLAGGMIISRLLTPTETGIYAVAAVLLGVAQVLRDFGAGQYLVQERELTEAKLRAVLGASFLFAWPLAALIALLGYPLASFYREPQLAPLLQLLAVNFVLLPFSSVILPMLRREMRFGAICAINLTHGLCSVLVSVTLAWHGFGFMSMAWGSVAATGAALLLSLWLSPPRMPWLPARAGIGRVIVFGAYATGGNLIDEAGAAAPDLVIGKMIGMDAVGIFGKAIAVLAVFHKAITNAVTPVVYPLYAAHVRGGGDAREAYLRTVSYMTAFAWPFFACVAVMALPILRLLYGEQWDAAGPLIRIMCFSSALYSISCMSRYFLVAIGQAAPQARLDGMTVMLRIALLMLAAPFGLSAVAWAIVGATVFRVTFTMRCLTRLGGISIAQVAAASFKGLLLTGLAVLAPLSVLALSPDSPALAVVAGVASVLLWFAGIVLVRHPLIDELDLARRKLAAALSH